MKSAANAENGGKAWPKPGEGGRPTTFREKKTLNVALCVGTIRYFPKRDNK